MPMTYAKLKEAYLELYDTVTDSFDIDHVSYERYQQILDWQKEFGPIAERLRNANEAKATAISSAE